MQGKGGMWRGVNELSNPVTSVFLKSEFYKCFTLFLPIKANTEETRNGIA